MNDKKVFITGSSGFLGRNLLEKLKGDNCYHVIALSSKPDELKGIFSCSNICFYHKDIINDETARDLMENAIVVNCAFPRNLNNTAMANGLQYNKLVFEAAVDNGATSIINISSQSVYSQKRFVMADENTPLCLESQYAVGKYSTELMLDSICREKDINYTNLRMASLIGPGFNQRIVNRFVIKMLNNEPITVVINNKKLGFLDVADAVKAIISVINYPSSLWKPIYTVGSGKGYTVEEIFVTISNVFNALGYEIGAPILEYGEDNSCLAVSYEKLHMDTGFSPGIRLDESIRRIVNCAINEMNK